MTGMADPVAPPTPDVIDQRFLERVGDGTEPVDRVGYARLVWVLVRRHGCDEGLAAAEAIVRRRSERAGEVCDRAAARRWFVKIAGLAGSGTTDFAEFVHEHGAVMFRGMTPPEAGRR